MYLDESRNMLYHGSPVLLEIGDELKTGDELGVSNNGGKSDNIYATGDFGYSMSDLEDNAGCSSIWEYALIDASMWAGPDGWVYSVDGEVLRYDEHFDVSPGSYILKPGARVTGRISCAEIKLGSLELRGWNRLLLNMQR